MRRPAQHDVGGFSLLEVLLAGAIGTLILGSAYMVFQAGFSTAASGQRRTDVQENARAALDLLIRQLRLAGYLNLGRAPNRIAIGTLTLLVLRGDVQLTGGPGISDTLFAVQPTASAVCPVPPCLLTGTNVYTVDAATAVTAFQVSAVTFAFFDQSDIALPTPLDGVGPGAFPNGVAAPSPLPAASTNRDAVRTIRITVTAGDPTVTAGPGRGSAPEQLVLSSDVRLRNVD